MIIIAFDPGETVGYAIYDPNMSPDLQLLSGQCLPYQVTNLLDTKQPQKVIIESFKETRVKPSVNLTPVEVIGVVKNWCFSNGIVPIEQMPAHVKHYWTNARLQKLGVYKRGFPHAMDAVRHLLYFISKTDRRWIVA